MSSRQVAETSEQQRRKKLNQIKREQARKHRRRMMVSVAAGVVIVLALAGGITWGVLASRPEKIALSGVQTFKVASRNHVTTPVKYAQTPTVGGDHNPTWLNCGIYDQPVPNENAVHDLEHGAVWITYRPDLPADQVAELQKLARSQTYITLSPYDGLSTPVVASAWGCSSSSRTPPTRGCFCSSPSTSRAPRPRSPARRAAAAPALQPGEGGHEGFCDHRRCGSRRVPRPNRQPAAPVAGRADRPARGDLHQDP